MNIVSSSQNLDTTKVLSLRYASGNTVLVVFPLEILYLWYFFNGKAITMALLSAAGNAGPSPITNGQGGERDAEEQS